MKPFMSYASRLLATLALSAALASPAFAQAVQGLDGRWEGAIDRPTGGKLTAVFNVATKDSKTTTTFDSPDQGAKGIAASVKREGDKVTFEVPMAQMTYAATLSADGKTISGNVSQGGGAVPLTMTRKAASATSALTGPAIAGVDGRWEGALDTGAAAMNLAFRFSTSGGKTTTVMDSPGEKITGIPALASRTGEEIKVEMPGIRAAFTGKLSADGKTLSGFWDQSGQSLPLTLTKK